MIIMKIFSASNMMIPPPKKITSTSTKVSKSLKCLEGSWVLLLPQASIITRVKTLPF